MHILVELSDEEAVKRILRGEAATFEVLIRRYNERLYRIARAILQNHGEAEDVTQQAFSQAYEHLRTLDNPSRFATWVTTIAVNESLHRRRRKPFASLEQIESGSVPTSDEQNPERQASITELRRFLESAIDALPETYRLVFVMREVEGMSTAETAECLATSEDNVKVRLHRARALLRKHLYKAIGPTAPDAFRLHLNRCDVIVKRVCEGTGLSLRAS